MKYKFMLAASFTLAAVSQAHACGDFDLACKANGAVNSWISGKAGSAAAGVVSTITPLINQVMAQQIPTIINDMNAAINNNVLTAKDAGDELVDRITKSLDSSFSNLSTFRDKLFSELATFQTQLFSEINSTLDKTFYQAHCVVAVDPNRVANNVESYMSKALSNIEFWKRSPLEAKCRGDLHLPSTISQSDPQRPLESFSLAYCVMQRTQDLNTPATTLANEYGDFEQNASDLMCVTRYDNAARQAALQYWIDAGRISQVWLNAANSN